MAKQKTPNQTNKPKKCAICNVVMLITGTGTICPECKARGYSTHFEGDELDLLAKLKQNRL